jgi:hypothetical protein
VWELECIWVFLWALQYTTELEWPAATCDVKRLVEVVIPGHRDPTFITAAKLRSTEEILDATDLTMRIHWAIRDAYLNRKGIIPEDLDWAPKQKRIPAQLSAAANVVNRRHYGLNWLTNFCHPEDWDHVDTPT